MMPRPVKFKPTTTRSLLARRSGGRAFTLIETLLAISILLVLVGVVTFTMFGRISDQYLDEGSQRFETVLRMARAEAANQGRRMRLSWSAADQRLVVLWEPEPLEQPGQFIEHTGATWATNLPSDLIKVMNSKREGAVTTGTFGEEEPAFGEDDEAMTTLIDFYPDGSSDTAMFELASRDEGDDRRAIVEFDGFNYLISTRIMSPSELAAWYEEQMNASEMSGGGY